MNKIKFVKTRDVKTPCKAHETDAGIDFFVPNDLDKTFNMIIGDACLIPTGIKAIVPEGKVLIFFNKSGVAVKKQLDLGACVVDSDFRGEIMINLNKTACRVETMEEVKENILSKVEPGDKLVQGILIDLPKVEMEEISVDEFDNLSETERGEGGFGSSGVK